jgi:transposase
MSSMDGIGLAQVGTEHASTTDRRSACSPRIEVITRGERRRVWAIEQKREIVLESLHPDVRPADVARRHGINTGLLYTWRRQMLEGQLGDASRRLPSFARVDIAPAPAEPEPEPISQRPGDLGGLPAAQRVSVPAAPGSGGVIEIMLPSGVAVRVDARVDGRALRRVLAALEGR